MLFRNQWYVFRIHFTFYNRTLCQGFSLTASNHPFSCSTCAVGIVMPHDGMSIYYFSQIDLILPCCHALFVFNIQTNRTNTRVVDSIDKKSMSCMSTAFRRFNVNSSSKTFQNTKKKKKLKRNVQCSLVRFEREEKMSNWNGKEWKNISSGAASKLIV